MISFKNDIKKLFSACDLASAKNKKYYGLRREVLTDIFSYIVYISDTGEEKRSKAFAVTNLNISERIAMAHTEHIARDFPVSLSKLCSCDLELNRKDNYEKSLARQFRYILSMLGKHYVLNAYDSEEISEERYWDYIKRVDEYISQAFNPEGNEPVVISTI